MGFSFSGSAPNQGLIFAPLEAVRRAARATSIELQAMLAAPARPALRAFRGAFVIPFAPPSIQGLGAVRRLHVRGARPGRRHGDISAWPRRPSAMVGASQQSPRVTGLFSSFTANDPQLAVEIDREKARSLGLPLSEITSAMQIYLGSPYVNDFDFNNRAYRVYVQADKAFRVRSGSRSASYYVAHRRGARWCRSPTSSGSRETTAPQVISHFNLFRSATINGSAAPGVSSGQAIEEMERLAARTLPQGFGYAWSGHLARGDQGGPAVGPASSASACCSST